MIRIGTLTLVGFPLEFLPLHRNDRFPRSIQKPVLSSRLLYAGRRPDSNQVPSELIPEHLQNPGFDNIYGSFDTSSEVYFRSSP